MTSRWQATIDPRFNGALCTALVQVCAVLLLSALLLDGGLGFRQSLVAALSYLVVVLVVVARRPLAPTRHDLAVLRWSFIPICIGVVLLFAMCS
ncbi:MAG: hypothetical protein DWQ37_19705 [Planctomycetota bacterium]|nr:MAG: hypothetical protein DWQ37_19705 [Planctomycetota bacterium]